MKKYMVCRAISIFFLISGILSIPLIDKHPAVSIFTVLYFFACIMAHDAAIEEEKWIIIKDNASMDRPE